MTVLPIQIHLSFPHWNAKAHITGLTLGTMDLGTSAEKDLLIPISTLTQQRILAQSEQETELQVRGYAHPEDCRWGHSQNPVQFRQNPDTHSFTAFYPESTKDKPLPVNGTFPKYIWTQTSDDPDTVHVWILDTVAIPKQMPVISLSQNQHTILESNSCSILSIAIGMIEKEVTE